MGDIGQDLNKKVRSMTLEAGIDWGSFGENLSSDNREKTRWENSAILSHHHYEKRGTD